MTARLKLAKHGRHVLLPSGEGGPEGRIRAKPEGRMRAKIDAFSPSPGAPRHPLPEGEGHAPTLITKLRSRAALTEYRSEANRTVQRPAAAANQRHSSAGRSGEYLLRGSSRSRNRSRE